MAGKDYYAILGVKKDATEDEIKKSFRRLAHEHHPDKGGDQQKFKDINEAYQVLGDKTKRSQYDQFGSAAFSGGGGGGDPFGGFGGQGFGGFNINVEDFGDLGDVFGQMFGFQNGRKRGQSRGSDIETEIALDFLETVTGANKRIKLYKNEKCGSCHGSGAEQGSAVATCKSCQGKGQVMQAARTMFGTIQTAVTCPECGGQGSKPEKSCTSCKGTGVERKTQEFEVPVPAGISDGEAIRITGAGEYPGAGGRAGDLFVRINVKPHPVFSRQDNDVISEVRIPYSTLSLGDTISIQTVDGPAALYIPEGTEPGTVFKIKNKGFPSMRHSSRGDHLVKVQPLVQRKLSREQRKALEQLKEQGL